MNTESQLPDVEPMQAQGSDLVTRARALKITNNDEFKAAGEMLVAVATLRKHIVASFKEPKQKAHEAHKSITALEAKQLSNPEAAEALLKRVMGDYLRAEETKRKQAEAEAAAVMKRQEEDRRIAEAERLDKAGHQVEAEQVLSAPVHVPVVEMEKPKAAGVSPTKRWAFRIIDPTKINRLFLVPDEKKIRAQVSSLGKDAAGLIGEGALEIYEDFNLSVRGAREAA